MTAPRVILADAIRSAAPSAWSVQPYPTEPTSIPKVDVRVWQTKVSPHPSAPEAMFEIALTITVMVSIDDDRKREDVLDDALAVVLGVVDEADWLTWADATRTATDKFHGYEITATAVGRKD